MGGQIHLALLPIHVCRFCPAILCVYLQHMYLHELNNLTGDLARLLFSLSQTNRYHLLYHCDLLLLLPYRLSARFNKALILLHDIRAGGLKVTFYSRLHGGKPHVQALT